MFFTCLLAAALIITHHSLCPSAEHLNVTVEKKDTIPYNAPRCTIRKCLTGPPPVCEKLQMKPCYGEQEVMTMLGKNFLCDTTTDGGGWILIQRRIRPGVDFVKNWEEYKQGFGALSGDFWIGLDFIYSLITQHSYELRVDMMYQNSAYYAEYSTFSIANEANSFRLTVSGYSGTAGDSLSAQNNMQFYTIDRPSSSPCTNSYKAGWWWNYCYSAFLNGRWVEIRQFDGIHWDALGGGVTTLESVEMKLRKKNY